MANSKVYAIKPSPGKGNGVFAAKSITAGTVIIRDTEVMQIDTAPGQEVTDHNVRHAFEQLSPDQQASFLSLSESTTTTARTKLGRIYAANAFGNAPGEHHMKLETSHVNHSCVPNAEGKPGDGPGQVATVAVRHIAKGEEIFITYNTYFMSMTAWQRADIMQRTWGFACTCAVCTLGGKELETSDMRRKLIGFLFFETQIKYPVELHKYRPEDSLKATMLATFQPNQKKLPPLTLQKTCAYSVLFAMLCESEGVAPSFRAEALLDAVAALRLQIEDARGVVVIDSARYCMELVAKALNVYEQL